MLWLRYNVPCDHSLFLLIVSTCANGIVAVSGVGVFVFVAVVVLAGVFEVGDLVVEDVLEVVLDGVLVVDVLVVVVLEGVLEVDLAGVSPSVVFAMLRRKAKRAALRNTRFPALRNSAHLCVFLAGSPKLSPEGKYVVTIEKGVCKATNYYENRIE